jgi:hypothetical protein
LRIFWLLKFSNYLKILEQKSLLKTVVQRKALSPYLAKDFPAKNDPSEEFYGEEFSAHPKKKSEAKICSDQASLLSTKK